MEGRNGSGNNSSCLLGFGEGGSDGGSGGLSPLMIMPLMASAPLSAAIPPPPSALLPPPPNDEAAGYDSGVIKARIMSHPQYPRLLAAYVSCHKVGAPAEVVERLEEACASSMMIGRAASSSLGGGRGGEDPALDQFMEAYCEMLTKYEQELSKPFKEAMLFLSRIDAHFKSLSLSPPPPPAPERTNATDFLDLLLESADEELILRYTVPNVLFFPPTKKKYAGMSKVFRGSKMD